MREASTCLGKYAVMVSDSCCLNHPVKPNVKRNRSSSAPSSPSSSIQNAVICLYKTKLSNQMHLTFRVTWSKNIPGQGLCIDIIYHTSSSIKVSLDHDVFGMEKGDRTIESCCSKIGVCWDFSAAKYQVRGPEPTSNFYMTIKIDSEIALRLGEANVTGSPTAKFSLVSRREYLYGHTQYSTKAQFCDSGATHDIVIRCTGNGKGGACRNPELSICIDEMQVICERSLQWKFRGNRVIYVDGQLVDVMWNFFDWFFKKGSGTGSAVFMFRRRSGFHGSLWFEEQLQEKSVQGSGVEFSLMIYACKRP